MSLLTCVCRFVLCACARVRMRLCVRVHVEILPPHTQVQKRLIEPFTKGEWDRPVKFRMPADVKVVEYVDFELQEQQEQLRVLREAEAAKPKDYNPLKKKSVEAPKKAEARLRPEGSLIQFPVEDLLPNQVYEFRVAFRNVNGLSQYTPPSHRAKTNRAEAPKQCIPPTVLHFASSSAQLLLQIPSPGGAPVTELIVETRNLDTNEVARDSFTREKDALKDQKIIIAGLIPGGYYHFRAQAVNLVGMGMFSPWCKEIQLPKPLAGESADAAVAQNAGQGPPPEVDDDSEMTNDAFS